MPFYKKGFTLIEVLAVVLIIGILVAVALPEYKTAMLNSRLSTLMGNVKTIASDLEVYHLTWGDYPPVNDLSQLDLDIAQCSESGGSISCQNGNAYSFGISADDKPIGGFLGKSQGLAYVQYLQQDPNPSKRNQRQCWADSANKLANNVCLNLEGELVGTSEWRSASALGHTTAVWNVYSLNN